MYDQVETYIKTIDWDKRLQREIPQLKENINHLYSESPLNILDIGCGPGKHLLHLAKEYPQHNFYGFDINAGFIQYAKDHSQKQQNLHFFEIDFWESDFSQFPKFNFIYSLGNSLMLIWGVHGPRPLFYQIGKLMEPTSVLFFQILNSEKPRDGYKISKIMESTEGLEYFTMKRFNPDLKAKMMNVEFLTLFKKKNETKFSIEKNLSTWVLVSSHDLDKILRNLGFEEINFWENYAKSPLNPDSSDSLLCCANRN
jgi:SAM-dependent methyltransferase